MAGVEAVEKLGFVDTASRTDFSFSNPPVCKTRRI